MKIFEAVERDLALDWQKMTRHGESQAPASTPASLETAKTKGEPVSIASDAEQGYQAVKNELAKFDQALPAVLERAKKLEGSPLADLALTAADAVLPPEAVASVAKIAGSALDELIALYNPQQAAQAPAAPAQ